MSKKKTTTSDGLVERLEALTPLRYYVHEGEKVSHKPQPMAVISDADAREVEDCLALAIAEIRRLEKEHHRVLLEVAVAAQCLALGDHAEAYHRLYLAVDPNMEVRGDPFAAFECEVDAILAALEDDHE